jgi:hypothetical protein
MPNNRIKAKLAAAVLVVLWGSVGHAAEVTWITGRAAPARWAIVPSQPKETDVIQFMGPTRSFLNYSLAEKTFGGKPVLVVDYRTRKIELKFEPPASESPGNFWNPVTGLEGTFGPLTKGPWTFFCTKTDVAFSLPFEVGVGTSHFGIFYYVDGRATGKKNGHSWVDAFVYLQDALAVAVPGSEIRVAEGVYRPDQGATVTEEDLGAAFNLKNGVTIKGGFAGLTAPDPNARDVALHETILSGDLWNNDSPVKYPYLMLNDGDRTDNSYHVVAAVATDANAVLDGFTITGGHAIGTTDPSRQNRGGGVYIERASATFRDCLILGNVASDHGGGVYCLSRGSPTFISCVVADNWSGSSGGGMYNDGSEVLMERCLISGNATGFYGGGIHNHTNGKLTLSNCIISGNMATEPTYGSGGGFYCFLAEALLNHCTLLGNVADLGTDVAVDSPEQPRRSYVVLSNSILWDPNAIWNNDQSPLDVTYCDVQGGWKGDGNIDADPCVMKAGWWDVGRTPEDRVDDLWTDGDYRLRWDSPCVDTGDPREEITLDATDFASRPRLYGAAPDMGAYELKNAAPVAKAGPDVSGFSLNGQPGTVILDGGASFDPEGTPLTYEWYSDGKLISTEVKFRMEFPLGEHTVTLIVSDGVNHSTPDAVRVSVMTVAAIPATVSPSSLARSSPTSFLVMVSLPKGKRVSDVVRSEPMLCFPGGIQSTVQSVTSWLNGKTIVMARFNSADLMAAVPTNGLVELQFVGKYTNGQFFSATTTVRIQ